MGGITTTLFQRPRDPQFNNTTLLLSGNFPTNGAQNNTFLDSSSNGFTITRNPSTGPNVPTQGTFSPFSQTGWSNYFNGSTDWLQVAANTAFSFGTGNFTIESWVYPTAVPNTYNTIFDGRISGTSTAGIWVSIGSGRDIILRDNSGNYLTSGSNLVSLNTWSHIAVERSGTTLRIYLNGAIVGSVTNSTNLTDNNCFLNRVVDVTTLNGTQYLSNFRIVKGTAVYNGAFTPSTVPLTNITNTSLLTCQSNRFVDNGTANSGSGFTITVTGTPSIQPFSPFVPSGAYTTTAVGGSGYFDGTGDYLSVPASSDFTFTGNFTIECWFYPTAALSTGTSLWIMAIGAGDNFALNVGSTSSTVFLGTAGGGSFPATGNTIQNAWNHLAVVRSGSTVTLYINGNPATGTGTTSATLGSSTTTFRLGGFAGGISGYITNWRVNNGQALYTSAFTPPTSPLTTTSQNSTSTNTKLLLNFTNAGIVDSTAKNVLETVGNAQISTTQSKFGGSSMSFDGTGDYLLTYSPTNTNGFGTGDFTIEMWFYVTTTASAQILIDFRPTGTDGLYPMIYVASGGGSVRYNVSNADQITGTTTISTSTWYHFALSRSGTSTRMFINGTQVGSTYTDSNNYLVGANRPVIGAGGSSVGATALNGYIDDLRISKVARYTANFNVPTIGFTDR